MRENNKGFSLVELIIAFAILALVAVGASAMIAAGSRFYSGHVKMQRLQYEAQLAMTQIQEYVINTDEGIAWDDTAKELYIVEDPLLTVFKLDPADHVLMLGSDTSITGAGSGSITVEELTEHVDSMNVTFTPADGASDRASMVTISLTINRDGDTYTGTETFALRNRPFFAANWSDLWDLMTN